MSSQRRGPWSNHEDHELMRLVADHGALNWVRIAGCLGSRTPKQCRERYHQNLKPSLNHEPITAQEGIIIEQLVGEIGKRWAEIARRLDGRSDNAVKNWWNGSQNRRKRLDRRRGTNAAVYEERFPRSAISLNHQPLPPLPRPSLTRPCLTRPTSSGSYMPLSPTSWNEMTLPSPSSSKDSDTGSNYATSPGRDYLPMDRLHRSSDQAKSSTRLPSFDHIFGHTRAPQDQLPTAPSSPAFPQATSFGYHQKQSPTPPQQQLLNPSDSRMKVSSLLR